VYGAVGSFGKMQLPPGSRHVLVVDAGEAGMFITDVPTTRNGTHHAFVIRH
jgi:hypothetical protein